VLIEERSRHWDDEFYTRWLYTAVTRAKERLFVIARD
jgi:ATP-dependent exoDNAse (exonuclease V) beta subunit